VVRPDQRACPRRRQADRPGCAAWLTTRWAGLPGRTCGGQHEGGAVHRTRRRRARALAGCRLYPAGRGPVLLPQRAWSAESGRYGAVVLAGQQCVRGRLGGPVPGMPWPGRKISQPSRCGRMTAVTARFRTATAPRVRSCSAGPGAGHRPCPPAGSAGRGGSTSIRWPKARSRRSAGERPAKASKKPRQIFRREFMQAEGPPAGNSPLPADLSTFPRWCRAEPAIMPLRQMFLPRSGCLPSQDPSRRRRRRSLRPSWVPLTSSGPPQSSLAPLCLTGNEFDRELDHTSIQLPIHLRRSARCNGM
jgi:hypothetical protein